MSAADSFACPIHVASMRYLAPSAGPQALLTDEIPGVKTQAIKLAANKSLTLTPLGPMTVRALLILQGVVVATIHTGADICTHARSIVCTELMLIVPSLTQSLTLESSSTTPILVLDLHWSLIERDLAELQHVESPLPYVQTYSECPTYKEVIKSAKTVSRTLLPPRVVPRLAMGSVETTGPDLVAAHSHPMLEQLFVGLSTTECTVQCDDDSVMLHEYDVLHIPLGSMHGVTVRDGALMHYVWIDCFGTNDYSWIDTQHQHSDNNRDCDGRT